MREEDFDTILAARRFEPASPDFAERIIASARPVASRGAGGMAAWLDALLSGIFPRPAFAIASIVLMGFIAGLSLPTQADAEDAALSAYMEDEGSIL